MTCSKKEDRLKRWDLLSNLTGNMKFKIKPGIVADIGLEDYIKRLFNTFDEVFKSWGFVNEVTAFELRKFTWIKGDHHIQLLMNHYGRELYININ